MTPQKLKKHHKHNIAILHYHLIKPTWWTCEQILVYLQIRDIRNNICFHFTPCFCPTSTLFFPDGNQLNTPPFPFSFQAWRRTLGTLQVTSTRSQKCILSCSDHILCTDCHSSRQRGDGGGVESRRLPSQWPQFLTAFQHCKCETTGYFEKGVGVISSWVCGRVYHFTTPGLQQQSLCAKSQKHQKENKLF